MRHRVDTVLGYWKLAIGKALVAVLTAGAASAQSFATQPLLPDVAADVPTESGPVLVAAWQPLAGAPVLSGARTGFGASLAAAGRPQPSIIVGQIAPGSEASFGIERLLPATVEAFGFGTDDLSARAALRSGNPDLFRDLVLQGHIDPPPTALAAAIQTELQRMNCYRSTIDGIWGRGSRGAVEAYYQALDLPDPVRAEPEPTAELYRAILLNGDAACPTPAPAATAAAPARTTTSPARTQSAQPAPARTAQPPAPAATGRSLTTLGTGVFR